MGSRSEGSPRGEVSAGEGTGGGSQRSTLGVREGGEGPRKGQGEPWGGASRLRGCAQWATYPSGGPDTASPRAHPRGLCCRLRSPGLHPGPSTAVRASVWDRTAGAPGGWSGNARTPSELIRPVASLGDVFCVEKSRDTSLYSAECAWRPALHSSPPGPTWQGSRPRGADCRWGPEALGGGTGPQRDGRGFGGVGATGWRGGARQIPPRSGFPQPAGLPPPLGREGCGGPQAVQSLPEDLWTPPPPHLGSPAFVAQCPGKPWGSRARFL